MNRFVSMGYRTVFTSMGYYTVFTLSIVFILFAGCARKVDVKTPVPSPPKECSVFKYEDGSIVNSCEWQLAEWARAKDHYLECRAGLSSAEHERVQSADLFWFDNITAVKPEYINRGGARVPVFYSEEYGDYVAALFHHEDPVRIVYANPAALRWEYFHFFEWLLRVTELGTSRDKNGRVMFLWEVVGHCTADDPMRQCCGK